MRWLLLSAALCVLPSDKRAEVRFGVAWPEGPGAAAVRGFRGVTGGLAWADSSCFTTGSSMRCCFLQGSVCVCYRRRSCNGIAATS